MRHVDPGALLVGMIDRRTFLGLGVAGVLALGLWPVRVLGGVGGVGGVSFWAAAGALGLVMGLVMASFWLKWAVPSFGSFCSG